MKYIIGDLIKMAESGQFDVIVHGCNCFCTMGGGIAAAIANNFPHAYEEDCKTIKGNRNKLGSYSSVKAAKNNTFTIVNAYTQYTYWDVNDMLSYPAVEEVFLKIARDFKGKRIGIPLIGAGLARGDWGKIVRLIEKSGVENITTVVFDTSTFNKIVAPTLDSTLDSLSYEV